MAFCLYHIRHVKGAMPHRHNVEPTGAPGAVIESPAPLVASACGAGLDMATFKSSHEGLRFLVRYHYVRVSVIRIKKFCAASTIGPLG